MHRTICTLLLAANTALTAHLETIMAILPPWATRDSAAGGNGGGGGAVAGVPNAWNNRDATAVGGTAANNGVTNGAGSSPAAATNATPSAPSTPQPTRLKVDNLSEVAKVGHTSSMFTQLLIIGLAISDITRLHNCDCFVIHRFASRNCALIVGNNW